MSKIEDWTATAIGTLIGVSITQMFTGGGIVLFVVKWALSIVVCRIASGIRERWRNAK